MTDKVINFRVDEDLKKGFEIVARNKDLSASQMLRAFMRDCVENYMRQNKQLSLLDEPVKRKKIIQKSVIPDSWRKK